MKAGESIIFADEVISDRPQDFIAIGVAACAFMHGNPTGEKRPGEAVAVRASSDAEADFFKVCLKREFGGLPSIAYFGARPDAVAYATQQALTHGWKQPGGDIAA